MGGKVIGWTAIFEGYSFEVNGELCCEILKMIMIVSGFDEDDGVREEDRGRVQA